MHQSLIMRDFDKVPILIGFTSEEILAFVRSMWNKFANYLCVSLKIRRIFICILEFSGADQAKSAAAYHDKDDRSLIPDKFNVPSDSLSTAGATLKKIYTNTTFVEDLASFIAVSTWATL